MDEKIFFVLVSVRMKHESLPEEANLSARIFSCCSLSSPETYSTFAPASVNASCNISVDFPMPGSPPIKINDPGTMPPPNTRFSSSSWVTIRGSLAVSTCEILLALLRSAFVSWRHSVLVISSFCTISSTKEFQVPQEGHFPCHLADSCPHCWQKKMVLALANLIQFAKSK